MILGFKKQFPGGQPTNFCYRIYTSVYDHLPPDQQYLVGMFKEYAIADYPPKYHTVREGQRFRHGDALHMAYGVRTKEYWQFNKSVPALQRCVSVQRIDILHRGPNCALIFIDKKLRYSRIVTKVISEPIIKEFGREWFLRFIANDGFDTEELFWRWFSKPLRNGQLIHWTDLKY